jgi:hypothetical protein
MLHVSHHSSAQDEWCTLRSCPGSDLGYNRLVSLKIIPLYFPNASGSRGHADRPGRCDTAIVATVTALAHA